MLDSLTGLMYIADPRIDQFKLSSQSMFNDVKEHRYVFVRKYASFVGQVISMSIVIGPLSQIMTRYVIC